MSDFLDHEAFLKSPGYPKPDLDGVSRELGLKLYRFMLRLRRCEEAILKEYHPKDEMRCPVHFCLGQEAVPAALNSVLDPEDYLFSHHRTHGYFLAKEPSLRPFLAELYGRSTGSNAGRAGSMDLSMPEVNFHAGAIMPGALAIALGVAYSFKLRKSPRVAVAGFGEGAAEEGLFWEAVNYASVQKLPVVFVCENNRYAVFSDQTKHQPDRTLYKRVDSFGMKSFAVFGNDVLTTRALLHRAVEDCRAGSGPWFVEAMTYRWNAHVGPEPDADIGYRDDAEVQFWKKNCPLSILEPALLEAKWLTADAKEKMIGEIDAEIEDAFTFAKASPWPHFDSWEKENYRQDTPLADKFLKEELSAEFDHSQAEAIPGPY